MLAESALEAWVALGFTAALLAAGWWLGSVAGRLLVVVTLPVVFEVRGARLRVRQGSRRWFGWQTEYRGSDYAALRTDSAGRRLLALVGPDGEETIAGPFRREQLGPLIASLRHALRYG